MYPVIATDASNANSTTASDRIRVDQSHIECGVLDRILTARFDEAVLLPAGVGPIADWPHQWFWDGHEHVDPAKEARAQSTRLDSFTTTLADEYARRGQDWETQLRQRAVELRLMPCAGPHGRHSTGNQG